MHSFSEASHLCFPSFIIVFLFYFSHLSILTPNVSFIFAENPDSPLLSRRIDDQPAVGPTAVRRSSEKKRRVKMADLRTLIETRMFSKSERTLEKVGLESTLHEKPLEQSVSILYITLFSIYMVLNIYTQGLHIRFMH